MKKRVLSALLLAAVFVLSLTAFADTKIVEPGEDLYYLDQAGVLSEETKALIYFNNVNLEEACDAQVVVVVMKSLGGADTGDYAYRLTNNWELNGRNATNRILVLMSIDDDDYYVVQGKAMERFLTPARISEINDEYLEPDFADRDYDAGAAKVFRAFAEEVVDHYGANLAIVDGKTLLDQYDRSFAATETNTNPGKSPGNAQKEKGSSMGLFGWIIVILILFVLLRPVFVPKYRTYRFFIFPRRPRTPVAPPPPPVPPRTNVFGGGPRPGPQPAAPRPVAPKSGVFRPSGSTGGLFGGVYRTGGTFRTGGFGGSSRSSGSGGSSRSSGFGGASRSSGRVGGFSGGSRSGSVRSVGGSRGSGAGRGR